MAPDSDPESQRRDVRDSLLVLAQLRREGETQATTVRVRNVSSGGLMAQAPEEYRPGARVTVELEGIGVVEGSVAWAEAGRIGIAFNHPIDKSLARKPVTPHEDEALFRPLKTGIRRPPLKSR